ncbi:hypothetical protein KDA23_06675 [Candidatus Saccharibacteria bacterium]|nr:hypothetical protein [Candidatus Saccharibacteria bacterium]
MTEATQGATEISRNPDLDNRFAKVVAEKGLSDLIGQVLRMAPNGDAQDVVSILEQAQDQIRLVEPIRVEE